MESGLWMSLSESDSTELDEGVSAIVMAGGRCSNGTFAAMTRIADEWRVRRTTTIRNTPETGYVVAMLDTVWRGATEFIPTERSSLPPGECIAFCVIGSGRQWESSHERRPQSVGKASAKVM